MSGSLSVQRTSRQTVSADRVGICGPLRESRPLTTTRFYANTLNFSTDIYGASYMYQYNVVITVNAPKRRRARTSWSGSIVPVLTYCTMS